MTIDTLTFTTSAFTGTASTFTLDLTVTPIAGSTDDNVTNITMSGSTTPIKVSYDNAPNQLSTLTSSPESIDISFVVNGVDYEFFNKGTGYLMVSGPTGNLTAHTVTNVTFVCYVEGTRILTERGEIAVEDLRIGDLVVTASGALRPIQWTGHRRIDARNHLRPAEANPIRIAADAFGPRRPSRDLWVSPGHCLCVDVIGEVLVRAGSLVNGTTVQQIETDSVVYWHVELDSHDVLLAENLPAESYLDMNNRSFFVESGVVSLIDTPDALAPADAAFCRPLHEGGAIVDAVRLQLMVRAQALGWTLQHEPFNDLHLVVDGLRVDPLRDGLSAHFEVPVGAQEIFLVSIASKPCDLPNETRDSRALGVCLKRLHVGDTQIGLDDPRLQQGFHALETYSWGAFRWTSGEAVLPASLFGETDEARRFTVDMMRPTLPVWVAPQMRLQQAS